MWTIFWGSGEGNYSCDKNMHVGTMDGDLSVQVWGLYRKFFNCTYTPPFKIMTATWWLGVIYYTVQMVVPFLI